MKSHFIVNKSTFVSQKIMVSFFSVRTEDLRLCDRIEYCIDGQIKVATRKYIKKIV